MNPIKLVKGKHITFKTYDPSIEYYYQENWVLIGSMGDPKTWGGTETVVTMKKGAEDGLAGCLIDLNVLQEILYKRPSGKFIERGKEVTFTHHLQSMLLADSNSVVGRNTILD